MTPTERKQAFLDQVKSEGRSSPEGIYWHNFYEFLKARKVRPESSDPPVPLILAAASESDASKHHRLSSQPAAFNTLQSRILSFLHGCSRETSDLTICCGNPALIHGNQLMPSRAY